MDLTTLIMNWVLFGVSNAVLGASVMMLFKGTLPPPMTHKKVSGIAATTLFVIGHTGLLVFGAPDLLQVTIETFTK